MTIQKPISIEFNALDKIMPMSLVVSEAGQIVHAGPTVKKIFPKRTLVGRNVFKFFDLRRPKQVVNMQDVSEFEGVKLYLRMKNDMATPLIGVMSALPGRSGVLLNLSFGISVVDAVRQYGLAGSDFAPTDLTVEMLYLVEAKSAAMAATTQMAQRLHGEKTEAEAEAQSDGLTGLQNRRALDAVLSGLLQRNIPFALMNLDLDFFKAVNDTLGHAAGDEVLKKVAEVLREETRDQDTVARVGGDEFVLIFKGLTDNERLSSIAERVIKRLEAPIPFRDQVCKISASIGLVTSTFYTRPTAESMVDDADVALYASKKRGRACHTIYSPELRNE